MIIPPGHILRSGYLQLSDIVYAPSHTLSVADVKDKITQYTSIGAGQAFPPPIVKWENGRPRLWDGHHRYIASLMLCRKTMLCCWVETPGE